MIEYKTDEEKAEEIKAWWKENGLSIIGGIALAVAGLFAWDYWQKYQITSREAASALYSEQKAAEKEMAPVLLEQLQKDYASTPYAAMASLDAAKQHAEQGQYDGAVTHLRWVIDNTKDADLKNVASLRLARVLTAMGKHDEALALVNQSYGAGYESLIEEIKGDIFTAQNKIDEARKAYERAMLANKAGSNEFIQLKLDNLGKGA